MKSRLAFVLIVFSASLVAAQKPNITNAKVQEQSGAQGLKPAIASIIGSQAGPLWIGYRIPAARKERTMCCWDSVSGARSRGSNCCLGCRMNSEEGGNFSGTDSNCSPPEPVPYAFVFLRAETGHVMRARVFSADCPLDFAGLPLYWLEQVNPEQSVSFLTDLAQKDNNDSEESGYRHDLGHQAVMAIAMHDVPAADRALEQLIQPTEQLSLRENVAFWLGVERGKTGLDLLRKYGVQDKDERFRKKVTFAISQNRNPEAIKDLIGMARNDSSGEVRGQALFWLAQIGGRKEAAEISNSIANDPDTEVKKKAVFALSQLHNGEGVPLLIQVARTSPNPAVRKQAFFWLGQSRDPRALDFIEEVLTK